MGLELAATTSILFFWKSRRHSAPSLEDSLLMAHWLAGGVTGAQTKGLQKGETEALVATAPGRKQPSRTARGRAWSTDQEGHQAVEGGPLLHTVPGSSTD